MADSLVQWLTKELIRVGNENMDPSMTVDEALTNVAEVIAQAIEKGTVIVIKGSATVDELNSLDETEKSEGDVWAVKDSGSLRNKDYEYLVVVSGDIVRWDGENWELFMHLDLSGYVRRDEFEGHAYDYSNPHRVTASQVGTYTSSVIDAKISEVARNHLDMRVTSDVVEFFNVEV
ncbi:MAG: hypothetical protein HUK20_06080 [Fibrobacter sp.]|nr:hypothetical protein [Fibrobacter sp.]